MQNLKLKIYLLIISLFSLPYLALAQESVTTEINIDPVGPTSFEGLVNSILGALSTMIAGIAMIMLVVAGIIYIFSQGQEQRVTLAKNIMVGAIIGLAVTVGARTILKEIYSVISPMITPSTDVTMAASAMEVVTRILNLILSVLAMIGVISLVWGGIIYLTSGGDDQQIEKGKKQIIYSIIGLVIAIGALVIIKQIQAVLTGG